MTLEASTGLKYSALADRVKRTKVRSEAPAKIISNDWVRGGNVSCGLTLRDCSRGSVSKCANGQQKNEGEARWIIVPRLR
jgi:hypothetical protein